MDTNPSQSSGNSKVKRNKSKLPSMHEAVVLRSAQTTEQEQEQEEDHHHHQPSAKSTTTTVPLNHNPDNTSPSMSAPPPLKTPRRFLFIASIGNPRPYRTTRHSAGHILLEALTPLLPRRVPLVGTSPNNGNIINPLFYKTYTSPSYMNESGPKLLRNFQSWLSSTQTEIYQKIVQSGNVLSTDPTSDTAAEWHLRGTDPTTLRNFSPTLVILHDELEAPLGKVRVKRGGPEKASLRGHRGLISSFESLRGKGLYPPNPKKNVLGAGVDLSVLRIGVGIGRPETRDRGGVAKYVLSEMSEQELKAVRAAAGPVLEVLVDELYRDGAE
ncbi:aminoacyl-tRNA hydrolase [Aspergillus vadensis CBS 113365]|uniref:Peptidyl-tRNA hydrolase n=1 Tax=Aspergillus vadensis (strain CBS 113365 / IMI 142717 / IBT 24658) TaxID=1448311 RepID=A0A319BLB3_ASPVC|nr:peptidyl-tRNA hydrolase [Aspergillus vadensis CBS 113365]PYH74046.1 peptidyl-tRNA hydrolase [Aspergillus vadensis CBS 113365]